MIKATSISRIYRNATCFCVVLVSLASNGRVCFADGDFQFWSTVGVSFDVDKDWSVAAEKHLKFGNDAGRLLYHHTDIGLTYKSLVEWIDIGFNFKQVYQEQSDGSWSRENRPHLNITLKGRLGTLDFSDRSRIEYRDKEYGDDLWRYVNKLEIALPYEFTRFKFRPYIADQVYINLDGSGFEKNRIYTGVTFELSENVESELYYVRQWSEFLGRWQDLSALGLQLKIRF